MKAWKINLGEIGIVEQEPQTVGSGCVKIKLLYSSLTLTDRAIFKGDMFVEQSIVPGRYGIGMVVETGENVKNVERGDIVTVRPFSACLNCVQCDNGNAQMCENKLTYGINEDGFLRDFAVVKSTDVYKLPERIEPKDVVFLEYIDMAIAVVTQLKAEKGEHIVITGATHFGIVLAQVALYYQIVPIIVDTDQARLAQAEKYGVYYSISSLSTDVKKKVFTLTGGRMAEMVAHTVESDMPLHMALSLAKNGGSLAIVGLESTKSIKNADISAVVTKQLKISGISGSNNYIPSAINMLANHTVKVDFEDVVEIPIIKAEEFLREAENGNNNNFLQARVRIE